MIEKAMMFATLAHTGQTRKGSDLPYIIHPMEVAVIAASILGEQGRHDEDIVCAAILHDTCEDAKVRRETLQALFNPRVADLVAAQSEDKTVKDWKTRKQHTIDLLREEKDLDVKIIALADKLANIRAIRRDQSILGDRLWESFHEKRKSEHHWYYASLADCLKELSGLEAYAEYCRLVKEVFGKVSEATSEPTSEATSGATFEATSEATSEVTSESPSVRGSCS
ncbi:HD domain-containing protein [Proteiniclasticum sp. QWL-01]|uniref:HD domain-containing protein n=1 Tax=Proteiniclasticum sp. QWL-01 TaxID=3036945 RepID=UPI00240F060E|nr:HD domain-containing protein [Proteiniclasticum sp. QWL-01]WFF72196.1 HD domain-containing protein [Proteiniclasticum sp. QWL-01]